jgi:hypothetical protein
MVELLGAIGGGAFVLASLIVGARLLALAARTREVPEAVLGYALFTMGGVGYPIVTAARLGTAMTDETRIALGLAGLLLMWTGEVAVCLFNWRVFRPHEAWAGVLTAAIAAGLGGLLVAQAMGRGFAPAALRNEGLLHHLFLLGQGLPLLWAALESAGAYAMMRRREALGLGDPVVTDRLRLWSLALVASFVINFVTSIAALVFGVDLASTVGGALFIGPVGLAAATAVWFAFFAPASYHARVRARAAAGAAGGSAWPT